MAVEFALYANTHPCYSGAKAREHASISVCLLSNVSYAVVRENGVYSPIRSVLSWTNLRQIPLGELGIAICLSCRLKFAPMEIASSHPQIQCKLHSVRSLKEFSRTCLSCN